MHERPAWTVVLHGGCKVIEPAQVEANRAGLHEALTSAVCVVQAGGTALEAVEAAICTMEDAPVFNAGTGSVRRMNGEVEMDAAIMDGDTLDIGAVCTVQDIKNPILAARTLLRRPETLIAGAPAAALADAPRSGPAVADPSCASHDTVGCVVLDSAGRIAAGVSTGGLTGAQPGRVGDSPLPGCGFYADSQTGGVAASGVGESISRSLLSARVILAIEAGHDPQTAVEDALRRLARVGGAAGLIALDREGRIGWKHNADHFAVAWASSTHHVLHVELANMGTGKSV